MNGSPVVADASVAVKWVVPVEANAAEAAALWVDTLTAWALIVPPHFAGEVVNAIYQRVNSRDPARHISEADGNTALAIFLAIPFTARTPDRLYEEAFAFAQGHTLPSVYDALYVVLAQMLGCELWTADRRLLTAIGSAAPWVRFIGDYQGTT